MKWLSVPFLGAVLALSVTACNRDLSPLNRTGTSYIKPAPIASCTLAPYTWDNFEQPAVGYLWTGGPGSPILEDYSTLASYTCSYSWRIKTGVSGSYGHWAGLNASSLQQGGNPVTNLGGATRMAIAIKVDQNVKFDFYLHEGSTNGGDSEEWTTTFDLTASPSWQTFDIPLSSMVGNGKDGVLATGSIQYFWLFYYTPYAAHTLYIDDIQFLP